MKILIVGSDLNSLLLAKYIKTQNSEHDIYVTTDDNSATEFFTPIDIKENDIKAIVDFVKYNAIEFTISFSPISIISGIADAFKKEDFLIFAPYVESARMTFFNSITKKVLYKLKINTPKFGIFDRENLAVDYIRRSKFPIVITNDFTLTGRETNVHPCFSKAKTGIQKIFENGNQRIIIENYIDEKPIYVYFITDGYSALPLISIERESGENYTTAIAPSQKVSDDLYVELLQRVIYPMLDDITKYTDNYVGIIGLKIKISNGSFFVNEVYNTFQHYDFQTFLSLVDEDTVNVLFETANGCLGDNYDFIKLKDKFSYTTAINKSALENTEDLDDDFIQSEDDTKIIITAVGATLNKAQNDISDFLETQINSELYQKITSQFKERDLIVK